MNFFTALKEGADILQYNNFSNAITESRILLANAIGISKEKTFFIETTQIIDQDAYNIFLKKIKMRLSGQPISQIIGMREFWKCDILVTADTLDPRSDSETIIETLLKKNKKKQIPLSILDLGTGSGCLTVAIAMEYPNSHGLAIDSNYKSLTIAKKNFQKHKITNRFKTILSSWDELHKHTQKKFDVIISNPPYIKSYEINKLQKEIWAYEPMAALNGGCNGMRSITSIIKILPLFMKKGSIFICEIGHDQFNSMNKILQKHNLHAIKKHYDINGIVRCLSCKLL